MSESPSILLDVSRTVARARLPAPTGIDRVERAYIRWASARGARFLAAVDRHQYLLGADAVRDLLGWIEDGGRRPALDLRGHLQVQRDSDLRAAQALVRRASVASGSASDLPTILRTHFPKGGIYLNVGHDNLRPELVSAIGDAGLRRAVLIHDTIPLDHPEFARRGTPEVFRAKLDVAANAELLIANSQHTADRLQALGVRPTRITIPLGIEPQASIPHAPQSPGQFLCLGTIEPRKNHMLLLTIWQRFWDAMGDASPKLVLIGRRGWENHGVFQIMDTHRMMGRTVIEAGAPSDAELPGYFARATALLFPSHAEGYGLPLGEALDAGLPCIASDLAALREVGGDVPDYLSPDDDAAWEHRIRAYAGLDGAGAGPSQRDTQLTRLHAWNRPTWSDHFAVLENAMETILVQSDKHG